MIIKCRDHPNNGGTGFSNCIICKRCLSNNTKLALDCINKSTRKEVKDMSEKVIKFPVVEIDGVKFRAGKLRYIVAEAIKAGISDEMIVKLLTEKGKTQQYAKRKLSAVKKLLRKEG